MTSGTTTTPIGGAGDSSSSSHRPNHRTKDTKKTTTAPVKIPENARVEGIMFVPHTKDGVLARAIQQNDDKFSTLHKVARVKVIERGGGVS